MITSKDIGKILNKARVAKGLSIEDAHRDTKIHPNILKDIENGIFDRLNSLYVKSFLKKYSSYLGLNTEDILKQYQSLFTETLDKEFTPEIEDKEEKENLPKRSISSKLQTVLVVFLSLILLALVVVLIGRFKNIITSSRQFVPRTEEVVLKTQQKVAKEHVKNGHKTGTVREVVKNTQTSQSAAKSAVELTLRASGEVWVQVSQPGKVLFSGFLNSGDSKTFKSDVPLTVWTGKAENLDFSFNTRKLGKITKGVVRDIQVSTKGVRVGDTWLYSAN